MNFRDFFFCNLSFRHASALVQFDMTSKGNNHHSQSLSASARATNQALSCMGVLMPMLISPLISRSIVATRVSVIPHVGESREGLLFSYGE